MRLLGYTGITWDGSTGTVTASRDGQRISLTIGEPSITLYTEEAPDGQNIPMDVAPYVDPATDRTYVPVGLIADALGYNVGWDGSNGTVIIDDVDAILAANTETYELMDKYLDYSRTFAQKNQKGRRRIRHGHLCFHLRRRAGYGYPVPCRRRL